MPWPCHDKTAHSGLNQRLPMGTGLAQAVHAEAELRAQPGLLHITCCTMLLLSAGQMECSPSMLSTAMSPAAKPLSARLLLLWLGPDAGGE